MMNQTDDARVDLRVLEAVHMSCREREAAEVTYRHSFHVQPRMTRGVLHFSGTLWTPEILQLS
jgi:hypothetical protein